eukprot:1192116-Prorocentrum_minimum.AAC.1
MLLHGGSQHEPCQHGALAHPVREARRRRCLVPARQHGHEALLRALALLRGDGRVQRHRPRRREGVRLKHKTPKPPSHRQYMPRRSDITSFYGSSCANNRKDARNTPETLPA